jgi:hypothetical protein
LIALLLLGAGCHGSKSASRLRASFGGGYGASIDTGTADCTFDTVDQLLSCAGVDGAVGSGREIDVAIFGSVAANTTYPMGPGTKPYATVTYLDPSALDLANGPRQWVAVDGDVHVSVWDGMRVAFSFAATMKPSDMTQPGMFMLSGDATILNVQTLR